MFLIPPLRLLVFAATFPSPRFKIHETTTLLFTLLTPPQSLLKSNLALTHPCFTDETRRKPKASANLHWEYPVLQDNALFSVSLNSAQNRSLSTKHLGTPFFSHSTRTLINCVRAKLFFSHSCWLVEGGEERGVEGTERSLEQKHPHNNVNNNNKRWPPQDACSPAGPLAIVSQRKGQEPTPLANLLRPPNKTQTKEYSAPSWNNG